MQVQIKLNVMRMDWRGLGGGEMVSCGGGGGGGRWLSVYHN